MRQFDKDRLKHDAVVGTLEALTRVNGCRHMGAAVYLFDDPVHALLSLHRRNLFSTQVLRVARHLSPKCQTWLGERTAGELADAGIDALSLPQHLADWVRFACAPTAHFPVVFARRSTLWQHLPRLVELLGLNASGIPAAELRPFEIRPWHLDNEAKLVSPAQHAALQRIYAPTRDLFTAVGNFTVVDRAFCASPAGQTLLATLAPYSCVNWSGGR